jgi:hypothetical protein
MRPDRNRASLKKFGRSFESLDLEKRVAAAKWLEGVILAQTLTAEERGLLVKASNKFIEAADEEDYVDGVNLLMDYLQRIQSKAHRAIKKRRKKRSVEPVAAV